MLGHHSFPTTAYDLVVEGLLFVLAGDLGGGSDVEAQLVQLTDDFGEALDPLEERHLLDLPVVVQHEDVERTEVERATR